MADFSPKSFVSLVEYSDDEDDIPATTQEEQSSRSPSPTLPFYNPRSPITRPSSPPLSPASQKPDSLNFSWTSEEMDSTIPPCTNSKSSSPDDVEADSVLAPNYTRAQSVPISGTKKKGVVRPPTKPRTKPSISFVPSQSLPPRTFFTMKRAADTLNETELCRARIARIKRRIGENDEPIDADEEDVEEEVCTPQAGKNKNFEKFIQLSPHAYISTQNLLKGRVLDDEVMSNPFVQSLLSRLHFQGWDHLFVSVKPVSHIEEVIEFYANFKMFDDLVVSSKVKGVDIVFDYVKLGEILIVPSEGLEEYAWRKYEDCLLTSKFSQEKETKIARKVLRGEMSPIHKLLFAIVNKEILPRRGRRHEANFRDMGIMHALDLNEKINLSALMIKHMERVTAPKSGPHGLAYVFLLTQVFKSFKVPLGKGVAGTRNDKITLSTLKEYDCVAVSAPNKKSSSPMTQSLLDLEVALREIAELKKENVALKDNLAASQAQTDSLKTEMTAQQNKHLQTIQSLMDLLPKPSS